MLSRHNLPAVICIFVLLDNPCTAAPIVHASAAEIDAVVERHLASRHIPGASIAVAHAGKLLHAKGYGRSNVELDVLASVDTVYELASVTKQFTAAATMMLVEEGRVSLDDKLPDILDGMPDSWSEVNVRHLLNHTSGIKNYTSIPGFVESATRHYDREEILRLVSSEPLEFVPGDKWNYSNTGYHLLGMIIEQVSGKDYGDFLGERIFQPLGMRRSRFNDRQTILQGRANGYVWRDLKLQNAISVSPSVSFSGGGLVTTAEDLVTWYAALGTEQVLAEPSKEAMWQAATLNDGATEPYGFGWHLDPYRSVERRWHGGGIPGFSTHVVHFVNEKLTIVVLTNLDKCGADRIADGIAELYLPILRENAPKPVEDNDIKETAFLRMVMSSVATGEAEPEWFTPEWQEFFLPDRVKEGVSKLGTYGELESFELMGERTENKKMIREYAAQFGAVVFRCSFTMTDDGLIDGIGLRRE